MFYPSVACALYFEYFCVQPCPSLISACIHVDNFLMSLKVFVDEEEKKIFISEWVNVHVSQQYILAFSTRQGCDSPSESADFSYSPHNVKLKSTA